MKSLRNMFARRHWLDHRTTAAGHIHGSCYRHTRCRGVDWHVGTDRDPFELVRVCPDPDAPAPGWIEPDAWSTLHELLEPWTREALAAYGAHLDAQVAKLEQRAVLHVVGIEMTTEQLESFRAWASYVPLEGVTVTVTVQ